MGAQLLKMLLAFVWLNTYAMFTRLNDKLRQSQSFWPSIFCPFKLPPFKQTRSIAAARSVKTALRDGLIHEKFAPDALNLQSTNIFNDERR